MGKTMEQKPHKRAHVNFTDLRACVVPRCHIKARDEVRRGLRICVKHGYMCITPVIVEQVPNGLAMRANQLRINTNADQRG